MGMVDMAMVGTVVDMAVMGKSLLNQLCFVCLVALYMFDLRACWGVRYVLGLGVVFVLQRERGVV